MSLAELIPLVNSLSQSDKLSLFKLLAGQIPKAELQVIFSASELSGLVTLRRNGSCKHSDADDSG
ncbi:hypothetical protein QUA26_27205 [Microcoleus sp. Pol12A4]|uniref:hypothetical protein n=1 Tax=unclassified Microcoleus TaxID=2642155 RepID=UPI002FD29D80